MTTAKDEGAGRFEARVIAVIGHALRTPVTTVRGLADVVHRRGEAPPELRAALRRESRILEELVDDLLVASDVTTVLPTGEPTPQPVGDVARDVWDRITADLGEARPDRAPFSEDDLVIERDGVVHAASRTLWWMLRHLLDNAVRYGSPPVRLEVHEGSESRSAAIHVRTHEPSATSEDVENAFQLFYRGEHAVMAAPGLGVGLTVTRRLARHIGGDAFLSWDGDDLVTTIRLPVPDGR